MPETTAKEQPASDTPASEIQRVLIPTPLGVMGIELTDEVLTRVVIVPIGRQRKQFVPLSEMKRGERTEQLDEVIGRFSEFLAGARKKLELPYDLTPHKLTPFSRRVFKETAKIPYGRTRTYQQIANNAGRPDGYRQVLAVLQGNPLPLVVPCHRVITSKSGVGSFIAGVKRKTWLLKMEEKNLPLL